MVAYKLTVAAEESLKNRARLKPQIVTVYGRSGRYEMVCWLVGSLTSPGRPTTLQNCALSSTHAFRQHGNIQSLYGIFVTVTMASTL